MARQVAIGIQSFEKIRMDKRFYVDKTDFIREWWENGDDVTLITRPRRFGKTLNMSMLECFFSNLIRQGNPKIKQVMLDLLQGKEVSTEMDEQIVFEQLNRKKGAIWSLLLASGYLKVTKHYQKEDGKRIYQLALTNKEVRLMFEDMILNWFEDGNDSYNAFIRALLKGDIEEMEYYMNQVAFTTFSYFDTGKQVSEISEPERFYHGFVLGLLVELKGKYHLKSNRESGLGRYDVMLEPLNKELDAIIIEFKVYQPKKEKNLSETLASALAQIEEKQYDAELLEKGIAKERIHHYGFAFEGKNVLIGGDC